MVDRRRPLRLEDDSDIDGGINLMPLVDVVFLLLIFFLAATTFANEESTRARG